jgi:hypothetical protein
MLGNVPTKVRLPLFNGIYRPLDRFAGDPTSGTTFGAFAAALCNTYQEEGGASCLPDTFRFAAIGGAIGAGAGLAIDAHEAIAASQCASPLDSDLDATSPIASARTPRHRSRADYWMEQRHAEIGC